MENLLAENEIICKILKKYLKSTEKYYSIIKTLKNAVEAFHSENKNILQSIDVKNCCKV